MCREKALQRAVEYVDSGTLIRDLARLVPRPSISQSEGQPKDLSAYLREDIGPLFEQYGFVADIHDNPLPGGAPLLLASHFEAEILPTVILYGHGDVCKWPAASLARRFGYFF
ncbi:acetylornithine deacetylase/succinyl-diaminopimelate desuccinylase-like protein [Sinorhizobium terangae]|uniref:hypothetical protein n=1 Tax=Sinorhizobium terangae TaxID=110322 RepID=UPI0017DB6E9C|nr:acetylornithine deacetylase/succinyl-diaminopimelate desuccinylase-like protein [Sinorhizobium terangae]